MIELTSNDVCIAATQSTNSEQMYRYWESTCDDDSSESQQHVAVAARASVKSEYHVATIAPTRATVDTRAQRLARKLAGRDPASRDIATRDTARRAVTKSELSHAMKLIDMFSSESSDDDCSGSARNDQRAAPDPMLLDHTVLHGVLASHRAFAGRAASLAGCLIRASRSPLANCPHEAKLLLDQLHNLHDPRLLRSATSQDVVNSLVIHYDKSVANVKRFHGDR